MYNVYGKKGKTGQKKKVKQWRDQGGYKQRAPETSTLQTSKRYQYNAEDLSIISINRKMLSGNKKYIIFQLMYARAYVRIWILG